MINEKIALKIFWFNLFMHVKLGITGMYVYSIKHVIYIF